MAFTNIKISITNIKISIILIVFLSFLKFNIDSMINEPISPEELADYNYKMSLVLDKVYEAKNKDNSAIAIHIKSLDKKNIYLIDLSILNKNNLKDKYISTSEYKEFERLFKQTYKKN